MNDNAAWLLFILGYMHIHTNTNIKSLTYVFFVFYVSNLQSFRIFNAAGYFMTEVIIRTCPGCANDLIVMFSCFYSYQQFCFTYYVHNLLIESINRS